MTTRLAAATLLAFAFAAPAQEDDALTVMSIVAEDIERLAARIQIVGPQPDLLQSLATHLRVASLSEDHAAVAAALEQAMAAYGGSNGAAAHILVNGEFQGGILPSLDEDRSTLESILADGIAYDAMADALIEALPLHYRDPPPLEGDSASRAIPPGRSGIV